MFEPIFTSLPKQAQAALVRSSKAIEGVYPAEINSWEIDVAALPAEAEQLSTVREVRDWANKSKLCLYYFECMSPQVDLVGVERIFADTKAHKENERAYPRLNGQSLSFYVGSSQSVAKRFSEHLGYGAASTYALQLLHWARPLQIKLRFVCAKYANATPYSVVQTLEDALWEEKQPMFGRQGRK